MTKSQLLLNLFGNWMAINNLKPTDSNQVAYLVGKFLESDYYKEATILLKS